MDGNGTFSFGGQHVEQVGLAKGKVLGSPYYNEQLYLQKYPDVAAAVAGGAFSSGLQHYILHGKAEGRSSGAFDEQAYLQQNPDVAAAVEARAFSSGLQHYTLYGQAEGRTPFFGTASTTSTLQGTTAAKDVFVFSDSITGINWHSQTTVNGGVDSLVVAGGYVGGGSADYALVQKFEPGKDSIGLPGSLPDYNLQTVNGSLNISTASGDLIAIVEGVPSLSPVAGISGLSVQVPGLGFTYLG